MFIGDSRRPYGPGILPLQHHGHRGRGWELDARSCILATRLVDRLDEEGQHGHWVFEDESQGDLLGGLLWPKDTREISGWAFAWPVSTGLGGATTPPATITGPGAGGSSGGPGPTTGGGGAAGEIPPGQRVATPGGRAFAVGYEFKGIIHEASPSAKAFAAMANAGGGPPGGADKGGGGGGGEAGGGPAGENEAAKGGAPGGGGAAGGNKPAALFGIGGDWLNPWPNAGVVEGGANVFGLGQEWLNPVYPWGLGNPKAPFGIGVDPYSIAIVGHNDLVVKKGKDGRKDEKDENAAWAGKLDEAFEYDGLKIYPTRGNWTGDSRFEAIRPTLPEFYPRIPKGFYGIALTATEEDSQVELYHPTDPRMVAAHRGGAEYGSIVTEVDGNRVDVYRSARLQSLCRVVRGPTGVAGGSENCLALNIGPTGQWDSPGALICDLPVGGTSSTSSSGGGSPGARIFGAPSIREGGPFDVGPANCRHSIGFTADGERINPLHLSTEALIRRPGTEWEDGPWDFERYYRRGGELDFPVAVHHAFDVFTQKWKSWTTSYWLVVDPKDPKDPQPTPEVPGVRTPRDPHPPPGEPTPPPGGGTTEPTPAPGEFWDPNGDNAWRNKKLRELQKKGEWSPNSDPYESKSVLAGVRETQFPSISFRAGFMAEGEPDLRFLGSNPVNPLDVAAHDALAPTVLRMDSYGAQGGKPGGPYFAYSGGSVRLPGGSHNYTQDPSDHLRHKGGTCRGGVVIVPPEVDLEKIDNDLAPNNLSLSKTFFMASPEVRFGAGLPELADGGLKSGHSWGADRATGDLDFYAHDSVGAETLAATFRADGTFFSKRAVTTTGAPYTVIATDDVILATATVTITLPDAAVNLGRTIEVKNIGTSVTVTVDTAGGNLEGDPSQVLSDGDSITVISDSADWWII